MAPVQSTLRVVIQVVRGTSVLTLLGCNLRQQTMVTL